MERREINIAVAGNLTLDPLADVLDKRCREYGLLPRFYFTGFNQYAQEIFESRSPLYKFSPDILILALSGRKLFENIMENFHAVVLREIKLQANEVLNHLDALIKTFCKKTQSIILLHNFVVPSYAPLGVLDVKQKIGLKRFFEDLNLELESRYKRNQRVYLFDVNECISYHGKRRYNDPKMYFMAKMEFSWDFFEILASEYMRYILPLKGMNRKCLVLDLDNTLWGGVIGEVGIHGIRLGHDPPGNAYLAFQKRLLSFYHQGILLAVSSKNNYDDAIKVIREHPDMVLREKHFSAVKINWESKADHLKDIARELNIGLDSLVFFDDDIRERECVKMVLPDVFVADVPGDPSQFAEAMDHLVDFEKLEITDEDKARGRMYAAEKCRKELKLESCSLDEFLHGLDLRVSIGRVNQYDVSRASQIVQRTNQFNLTARRYTEEQIKSFSRSRQHLVLTLKAKDKFGDMGTVGLCIVCRTPQKWIIDAFLLSCRALSRGLEQAFLCEVIREARKEEVKTLEAEYIPNEKNKVCADFYKKNGFKIKNRSQRTIRYSLSPLRARFVFPSWIKIHPGDNHE